MMRKYEFGWGSRWFLLRPVRPRASQDLVETHCREKDVLQQQTHTCVFAQIRKIESLQIQGTFCEGDWFGGSSRTF